MNFIEGAFIDFMQTNSLTIFTFNSTSDSYFFIQICKLFVHKLNRQTYLLTFFDAESFFPRIPVFDAIQLIIQIPISNLQLNGLFLVETSFYPDSKSAPANEFQVEL